MNLDLSLDPFVHFERLVSEATGQGLKDANAMTLATVGADQKPSARIVLYKGLVRGGLSFYTNYLGRKGRELTARPNASACFFWPTLERQVRVDGEARKLTREESEAYFRTRARLSQLGAWASHQSEEIPSHQVVDDRIAELEREFEGREIPCPPHWGGFHLVPSNFEFWFGRQGRLHDRFCYERQGSGWRTFMRSP